MNSVRALLLAGVALAGALLPADGAALAASGTAATAAAPIADTPAADTPAADAVPAGSADAASADLPQGLSQPSTLTQALVEAYNNNATLQEQRAVLRQADEQVPTALAGWKPTVQVSGTLGLTNQKVTEPLSTLNSSAGNISFEEHLHQSYDQITLTQPLYQGGKTTAQLRQAKNGVYAARAQLMATEQTVFLNVVQAYVTVVTDAQVLALNKNDENVLRQQLKDTNAQFQIGSITMTSVAQAQAALAQAIAQVEVATGNLKIARENFRQLVGAYPADKLTPPPPLDVPVKSKTAAAALAVANNPNVVAAEFTDAADKDGVNVAFAALMPTVEVQASAFHETGQNAAATTYEGASVVGQLTVPLYQGGQEYAAIRSARAKEQQAFAAILDAKRTAWYQAGQAYQAVTSSRAAIVATNAEIKANAIALDGTEREQLVGTRTTLDVLNAQELLLNSQVQQVQNIGTLVSNTYGIAAAIGRLTVRDLGLPVQEYDDLKYYDAVKYAGFGTGESADRAAGIAPDGALLTADTAPAASAGPAEEGSKK